MSKSLRTRPQTLYQQGGLEHGAFGNDQASAARGSASARSSRRPDPTGASRSSVSSNLKKRLSTRYKDGHDALQQHVFRMAEASSIPEVPDLPSTTSVQGGEDAFVNAALSIPGFNLAGLGSSSGARALDESQRGTFPQPEQAALSSASSLPALRQRELSSIDAHVLKRGKYLSGNSVHSTVDLQTAKPTTLCHDLPLSDLDEADAVGDHLNTHGQAPGTVAKPKKSRGIDATYTHFLNMNKEVASLENDMVELKELLREWTTLPASIDAAEAVTTQSPKALGGNSYSVMNSINGETG